MKLRNPRLGDEPDETLSDRSREYRVGRKMRNHIYAVDPNSDNYEDDIEIAVAFDAEDGVLIVEALNAYVGFLQERANGPDGGFAS